jgi:hypothetical protein
MVSMFAEAQTVEYGDKRKLAVVADKRIRESSGLARSYLQPDLLWTHNDSGDVSRLFLIDLSGETRATIMLDGAEAVDWEDMCAFQRDGKDFLLIGDVGDNRRRRKSVSLYLLEEPHLDPYSKRNPDRASVSLTFRVVYADGPQDCESLAVHASTGKAYLVSKNWTSTCVVHEVAMPVTAVEQPLVAKRIATLPILGATAMDISPDGRRAVIQTYFDAYEYSRLDDESWAEAFAGQPRQLRMPRRRQGETVCYGADGKTLFLLEEADSPTLWTVPADPDPNNDKSQSQ